MFEEFTSDDRLNTILDKISKYGMDSLTKQELNFLNAYSNGDGDREHDKLNKEDKIIYDDLFKFEWERTIKDSDCIKYYGIIYAPDIKRGKKTIKGRLSGCIIEYENGQVILDFQKQPYDIFDFCEGIEYELDDFIDLVISEIKNKNGN